ACGRGRRRQGDRPRRSHRGGAPDGHEGRGRAPRLPRARRRGGLTLVTAGRVGRAHGWDGSFYVEGATHDLPEGTTVTLEGRETTVERRAGTSQRPLIRLAGVSELAGLHGRPLLVDEELGECEWLASDLEGCEVVGMGRVARVLD